MESHLSWLWPNINTRTLNKSEHKTHLISCRRSFFWITRVSIPDTIWQKKKTTSSCTVDAVKYQVLIASRNVEKLEIHIRRWSHKVRGVERRNYRYTQLGSHVFWCDSTTENPSPILISLRDTVFFELYPPIHNLDSFYSMWVYRRILRKWAKQS